MQEVAHNPRERAAGPVPLQLRMDRGCRVAGLPGPPGAMGAAAAGADTG